MNSNTKTLLGLIAAGAVGVVIGMLLAPEKGSDLRKSIKDTLGDLGDKLNDIISEGKDKVVKVADDADAIRQDVKTTVDHGNQMMS
jgi:gas vesicle protein